MSASFWRLSPTTCMPSTRRPESCAKTSPRAASWTFCRSTGGRCAVARYFPDLTDGEWQWGGSPQQIEQSIRGGRIAVMVGWEQVLGESGVDQVAAYVTALGTGTAAGHPGQTQYNQFCIACHGADGSGNAVLGAPSLVDDVSLYGNSRDALVHSIATGRSGEMPAFGERLDDAQVQMLVALLLREDP